MAIVLAGELGAQGVRRAEHFVGPERGQLDEGLGAGAEGAMQPVDGGDVVAAMGAQVAEPQGGRLAAAGGDADEGAMGWTRRGRGLLLSRSFYYFCICSYHEDLCLLYF